MLLGSIMGAKAQEEEAITFKRRGNAPKEVVLGIHCRSPFTIDWGDGVREEFPAKNYGVDGIQGEAKGNTIRIYGDPEDFIALYLGNNDKGNSIEELNITRLKRLRFLHCQSNELSQLNLSSGFMLEELHLANNHLKSLDVKHSPRLDMLICYGNEIESLDLSELNRLIALRCENNKISSLQIDHLRELTVLRCGGNPIEQLDVSKNKKLQQLFIENSAIKHLDVSTLDDLRVLNLNDCGISQIDLSGNSALHVLYANNNEFTQLTLTQQPELEKVQNKYAATLRYDELSIKNRALQMAEYELYGGAEQLNEREAKQRAVTTGQVATVAKNALVPENACVLEYRAKAI